MSLFTTGINQEVKCTFFPGSGDHPDVIVPHAGSDPRKLVSYMVTTALARRREVQMPYGGLVTVHVDGQAADEAGRTAHDAVADLVTSGLIEQAIDAYAAARTQSAAHPTPEQGAVEPPHIYWPPVEQAAAAA
jgi:hypothetical protein